MGKPDWPGARMPGNLRTRKGSGNRKQILKPVPFPGLREKQSWLIMGIGFEQGLRLQAPCES